MRAIQRALLLTRGIDETRKFWEQNPLVHHGTVLHPNGTAAGAGVCASAGRLSATSIRDDLVPRPELLRGLWGPAMV
jgi:hypothetical protein